MRFHIIIDVTIQSTLNSSNVDLHDLLKEREHSIHHMDICKPQSFLGFTWTVSYFGNLAGVDFS